MNRNHCPQHIAQHKESRAQGSRSLAAALIELAHRCGDLRISADDIGRTKSARIAYLYLGRDGDPIHGDAGELARCIFGAASRSRGGSDVQVRP